MRNKLKNIQSVLFMTYSLIIIVVFTVLVLWFYHWSSNLLRANATSYIVNMGKSLQEQTDSEIQKMNNVSLNVIYSGLIKDQFKKYLSEQGGEKVQESSEMPVPSTSREYAKELADILTAAIGPSRPVEQLYLYDLNGKVYGNGFDNSESAYVPGEKPWYKPVVALDGGKYIQGPILDKSISKYISIKDPQYTISMFRLFLDTYNSPMGIVEVKQYYNLILKSIINYTQRSTYQERILVYDQSGNIIFPLNAAATQYEYEMNLSKQFQAKGEGHSFYVDPLTSEKALLSFQHSDYTGWNTVIIVTEDKLFIPLNSFTQKIMLLAIFLLLFAILLSFVAAKKITQPILKIHRTIRSIRPDNLGSGRSPAMELNSGLNELDQLHWSFLRMSERLKESMETSLLAQSQEMQAKLVALQSQMNPHFLYNTLATIHVMAEENMNQQIIAMTENMSDFLRYFSSDQSSVNLQTELSHTDKYLEINSIRHGRKLQYSFDVDEEMFDLKIPKLIVQPLVENALKFATQYEPPWDIQITGQLFGNSWSVTVSDNGPGFSADSLQRLHSRIAEMDNNHNIPALQLDGMGLLNIYIRLKLTYGDGAQFSINNLSTGGAAVTIGGSI